MGTGSANPRKRRISTSARSSLTEAAQSGAVGSLRACHAAHGEFPFTFSPVEPQLVVPRMGEGGPGCPTLLGDWTTGLLSPRSTGGPGARGGVSAPTRLC